MSLLFIPETPELGFELFKYYSKRNNLDFFRMSFFETCAAMQSVLFTCFCFTVTSINK